MKFLEISNNYHPGKLQELLKKSIFSYSNAPYRIKDINSILHGPHHSIIYDEGLENLIAERVKEIGADGKSILGRSGNVYLVNLREIACFFVGQAFKLCTRRRDLDEYPAPGMERCQQRACRLWTFNGYTLLPETTY